MLLLGNVENAKYWLQGEEGSVLLLSQCQSGLEMVVPPLLLVGMEMFVVILENVLVQMLLVAHLRSILRRLKMSPIL